MRSWLTKWWPWSRRRCARARPQSTRTLLISPLEGEMAGRPEGGAVPPAYQSILCLKCRNPKPATPRSFAPPSALPGISPSRGEIGCRAGFRQPQLYEACLPLDSGRRKPNKKGGISATLSVFAMGWTS
ncbi:MAG: hypothetical protein EOS39_21235 [Mesorhizobium sp.]|nr:MAG: hypothetical protein EOS39_21235 [Mesorhizobium sp.]